MRFSKSELGLLKELALGRDTVNEISINLKKDKSQIYRLIKSLDTKGFVKLDDKNIKPYDFTHVKLLLQELSRQSSFIDDLSGCGLELYLFILNEPKSINEIIEGTGIKRSTIFYKFKKANKKSFVKSVDNKYQFNRKFWSKLNDFFIEYEKYTKTNDSRIPADATIIFKDKDEVVFFTKQECKYATLTGFSSYTDFGIKIYTIDNNYYLPQKSLTKKKIFLHSLYRTEKEKTIQHIILLTLFYIKYKKELKSINHEILDSINKVLSGDVIKDYPILSEIRERAEVYDIKL